jgi:hypothetical protein
MVIRTNLREMGTGFPQLLGSTRYDGCGRDVIHVIILRVYTVPPKNGLESLKPLGSLMGRNFRRATQKYFTFEFSTIFTTAKSYLFAC